MGVLNKQIPITHKDDKSVEHDEDIGDDFKEILDDFIDDYMKYDIVSTFKYERIYLVNKRRFFKYCMNILKGIPVVFPIDSPAPFCLSTVKNIYYVFDKYNLYIVYYMQTGQWYHEIANKDLQIHPAYTIEIKLPKKQNK